LVADADGGFPPPPPPEPTPEEAEVPKLLEDVCCSELEVGGEAGVRTVVGLEVEVAGVEVCVKAEVGVRLAREAGVVQEIVKAGAGIGVGNFSEFTSCSLDSLAATEEGGAAVMEGVDGGVVSEAVPPVKMIWGGSSKALLKGKAMEGGEAPASSL